MRLIPYNHTHQTCFLRRKSCSCALVDWQFAVLLMHLDISHTVANSPEGIHWSLQQCSSVDGHSWSMCPSAMAG